MTRRRTSAPEPPLDVTTVAEGDMVTAHVYPCRTRYNKPVLITGIVKDIFAAGLTLQSAGGYHSIRVSDIVRIKVGGGGVEG